MHKSYGKQHSPSTSVQVSSGQQNHHHGKESAILKEFVMYFVKEFEAKLSAYHLILEGDLMKAGKFSDSLSDKVGQGIGGAVGGLLGTFMGCTGPGVKIGAAAGKEGGQKLGNIIGSKKHMKEVMNLSDLVYRSQRDKSVFRSLLVEAGCDIFQSFEMQFMKVTTNDGRPRLALRYLARDAVSRAISYLKQKKDTTVSESVILGESKKLDITSLSPGYEIMYQYECIKKRWNTAGLFDNAGLVIEERKSPVYYKKKGNKGGTTKYGYRRLLLQESWDEIKGKYDPDNIADSKSGQFTDYKYGIMPPDLAEQSRQILADLDGEFTDLEEKRLSKILVEVKDDILGEISLLKEMSHGYLSDMAILLKIERDLNNLKERDLLTMLKHSFKKADEDRQKIVHCIEEVRKQNREGHSKTQEGLIEVVQQLGRLLPQESPTKCITSFHLGMIKYYYISRSLNRCVEIKDGFKKEKARFLLTSKGHVDASQLQQNQNIILVSNLLRDFEALCRDNKHRNIHWLKEVKGTFLWQHSQGSLCELRKFVDDGKVQSRKVEKISNLEGRVVVISAGPGMGKSTLLTHLAAEQARVSSPVKVIRINFNDHTKKLSEADFESSSGIVEFMKEISEIRVFSDLKSSILLLDGFDEIASNVEYKEKMMKLMKFTMKEVKLLWVTTRPYAQNELEDKLSVISYSLEHLSESDQKELLVKFWKTCFVHDVIIHLLMKIGREYEDAKIANLTEQISRFIHSGIIQMSDYGDNLEQIKVMASNFDISKKEESVKILSDLVNDQLGKQNAVSEKVEDILEIFDVDFNVEEIKSLVQVRTESYAAELIRKFSKSVSDKEREFTGVPLQVMMLAEAFQEEFYDDLRNFCDLEPSQRLLNKPMFPKRLNILVLYECFIEKKHKINFVEKGNMDLTNEFINKQYKNLRKVFMEEHRLLALNLVFSEDDLEKFISEDERDRIEELKIGIERGEENMGIVHQVIDGKPQFIHRTFAEYFAAQFLLEQLKKVKEGDKRRQVCNFLADNLFKKENEMIRHFFDRMLTKKGDENHCPLHMAVLNNDMKKIIECLADSQGGEGNTIVDNLDNGKRSALHLAAAYGGLDEVEFLLRNGSSVGVKDEIFGWTPLSYADKCKHWCVAELLLKNGACGHDMHDARKDISTCVEGKKTLLHLAAEKGYVEFAKTLVKFFNATLRVRDDYNRTPLHIGARFGEMETVKFLLNEDREVANYRDLSGKTPLDIAVYRGHLEVVQYLGESKSDLSRKELDEMRLNAAACSGDYELVEILLKGGVDVNSEVLGWTSLHQAAMEGHFEVTQLLVENGAEIGHLGDKHPNPNIKDGWTPLHGAANSGHYDVVKYIVEELIRKDAADDDEDGQKGKMLLDINRPNHDGYTPLHSAARGGHLEVVRYYTEELRGMNIDISVADKKGTTPLHTAAFHGCCDMVEYLVEKGANVDAVDKWGSTVLFNAACCNDQRMINFLLSKRASVDSGEGVIGKIGLSVLHVSALYGDLGTVKRLVEGNMCLGGVDAGRDNSFTPLHAAALSDSTEIIKYLIREGARVDSIVCFSNIARVLENEGNALIGASVYNLVEKLIKVSKYLNRLVSVTPYFIYKTMGYYVAESLELLRQDQGLSERLVQEFGMYESGFIHEKYFKEQVTALKGFIRDKENGDVYLLEKILDDPPQKEEE